MNVGSGDGVVWNEAPLVILRLNAAGEVIDCNPYARQLTGVDMTGMTPDKIFVDLLMRPASLDISALTGAPNPSRFHLPTATGVPINLLFRFSAVSPAEVLAIGWHDMPELIQLQQQLIDLNNELSQITRATVKDSRLEMDRQVEDYRSILEAAGEGIIGLDAEGRHTVVNPAASAMLGYQQDELIGKSAHALWHGYHLDGWPSPEVQSPIHQTLTQGVAHTNYSDSFRRKDGSLFPVTFTSRPIIDHRRVVGAVVTFVDITERQHAEGELKRFATELEQQNRAITRANSELKRFAEVTAHHLQEPARRMVIYTERLTRQLGDQINDEEARLSLEFIGQQGQRQLSLLRDVELYLESNQPRGEIVSVDVGNTVNKILTGWQDRINAAGAVITLGPLPPARMDLPRFKDVLSIALDNALSHGRGECPLTIAIAGEVHENTARYSVSDNGPGIEEQYRERVFDVFERLTSKGNVAGTGIGLAILRRIVESCDGSTWIEETPGGGCRLQFEMPVGNI
jgi:PAS domain S-box-containing protein